jgi:penicillin-insensitive murein endopeptidase
MHTKFLKKRHREKFLSTVKQAGIAVEGSGLIKPIRTVFRSIFFVPVVDSTGTSVALPTGIPDKFGYGIEFDGRGRFKDYTLDFDAMAEHLSAIRKAADTNGVRILRVIFDNDLQTLLFKTPKGSALQKKLPFSVKKPWIRHDEHYHIDFSVPCKPLTGK